MKKEFDALIFIGRFQPLHYGHVKVIEQAKEMAENVLILVGSANRPRTARNPFTYIERKEIIEKQFPDSNLLIHPLDDILYNDVKWTEQVQRVAANTILPLVTGNTDNVTLTGLNDLKIGLIGCEKDGTSYYLKMFPNWKNVGVEHVDLVDATDIRNDYFTHGIKNTENQKIPSATINFLKNHYDSKTYKELIEQFEYNLNYKVEVQQYPRNEVTVDPVVVQAGHILLVKRKNQPGKGLWALPGGFLNPDEDHLTGTIRELREETLLKVPDPVLRGSIVKDKVFSNPHRSERARIVTIATYFKLENVDKLPRVYGADDAEKAKWVPLSDLAPEIMFEDHYDIIQHMIGN